MDNWGYDEVGYHMVWITGVMVRGLPHGISLVVDQRHACLSLIINREADRENTVRDRGPKPVFPGCETTGAWDRGCGYQSRVPSSHWVPLGVGIVGTVHELFPSGPLHAWQEGEDRGRTWFGLDCDGTKELEEI